MKAFLYTTLFAALLPTFSHAAPKNIIFMIGDGMGPAYLSAYRYYQDNPATKQVETTVFDQLWVGMASTYPDDDTIVTDSAAGATALATRTKSYNGAISVNHQHQPLTTLLEIAKAKGKATGIISTSQINHATPASFMAHNKSRKNYLEIADDYVDNKVNQQFVADLMFGGGTDFFIRPDRNLVNEFQQAGYQYADNWSQFNQIDRLPALALLAPVGLPSALDSSQPQQLTTMTATALALFSQRPEGFVLMIEGSQIDWCGHANDIACAMAEMDDFAKAVALAKAYVDQHPDTLLVVTADHETGGLSLGADGFYAWDHAKIKGVTKTAAELARIMAKASPAEVANVWLKHTSLNLTAPELQQLQDAHTMYLSAAKETSEPKQAKVQLDAIEEVIKHHINTHSRTGWTSGAHTAIDVPVMAWGTQRSDFAGFQDNTDIAHKLMSYLETAAKQ